MGKQVLFYEPFWKTYLFDLQCFCCCQQRVNIKRHYDTKHSNFSKFVGQARKDKLDRLKDNLKQQSSVFQKQTTDSKNNTLASYRVAQIIVEEKRAFTDGEFAKKCMMAVVESICPEKKELFLNVSLSARTVTRRIEEMKSVKKITLKNYSSFQ